MTTRWNDRVKWAPIFKYRGQRVNEVRFMSMQVALVDDAGEQYE